jgi:NSS family neurotransmitter:Na+ symporter
MIRKNTAVYLFWRQCDFFIFKIGGHGMSEIKQGGEQFGSRWGLLCTILGMAVGTGNVWRFPREVAANGGGAFIICCFAAIVLWAIPLIIAESLFGKKTRFANAGAFKTLLGDKFTWMGAFCMMGGLGIGAYYGVVLGWCMKYIYLIATGFIGQVAEYGLEFTTETWNTFAMGAVDGKNFAVPAWNAVYWTWGAYIIAGLIIWRGVQGGLEIGNKIMVPAVYVLLIILVFVVVTFPGASKGYDFMFHIDPADFLKPKVWLSAFTQAA